MQSVSDKTRQKYLSLAGTFKGQYQFEAPFDNAEVDAKLEQSITQLYLNGESTHEARYFMAAVCWTLLAARGIFPRATLALKGFTRLCPDVARSPATWEAMVLMAGTLLQSNHPLDLRAAAGMLVQFDVYARPGEVAAAGRDWMSRSKEGVVSLMFYLEKLNDEQITLAKSLEQFLASNLANMIRRGRILCQMPDRKVRKFAGEVWQSKLIA